MLYGQSWGGMLAIEHALAYPQHLNGLVISNMTASIPSYVKYVNELRAGMPSDVDSAMKVYEDRGDYLAPEYQQLVMDHLYSKHICRLTPWPEPALRSFAHLNTQVYNTAGPQRIHRCLAISSTRIAGRPASLDYAYAAHGWPIRHDVCSRCPAYGQLDPELAGGCMRERQSRSHVRKRPTLALLFPFSCGHRVEFYSPALRQERA